MADGSRLRRGYSESFRERAADEDGCLPLKIFLAVERANLRSRFRSETNTSIALVPFSDPRSRLSLVVFGSDCFVASERVRFADFTNLFIQRIWK